MLDLGDDVNTVVVYTLTFSHLIMSNILWGTVSEAEILNLNIFGTKYSVVNSRVKQAGIDPNVDSQRQTEVKR